MRLRPYYIALILVPFGVAAGISPEEQFKIAKYHYDAGNLQKALPSVDKVLEDDTVNESAYYLRALIRYGMNDCEASLQDVNKAIQLTEKESTAHAEYLVLRARARLLLGEADKALRDVNSSILLSGTNEAAFLARATIKQSENDYRGAIADLSYAIEHFNPVDPEFYALRAKIVQEYHHPAPHEALFATVLYDLQAAISLDSDNYTHYRFRCSLYLSHDQKPEAMADLATMIETYPDRSEAYLMRGKIHMEDYAYQEAIEDFSRAIELQPHVEKSYRYRALCYHNTGLLKAARDDLSSAISLLAAQVSDHPADHHRQIVLAETYIQRGLVVTNISNATGSCEDFLHARELGVQKGNYYFSKFCNTW